MGMGATPELALAALRAKAEEAAQKAAPQLEEKMVRESRHAGLLALVLETESPASKAYSKSWQFEIIDVRFTPGPIESGDSGWLVYGTLTRKEEPEQKSTSSIQQ